MRSMEGERLMELRERSRLTQQEVGDALGVSNQTVSNWENGRKAMKLSPIQMLKLCQLLDCSLEELAGQVPVTKPRK